MGNEEFFKAQQEASLIKTRIITKYFFTWSRVMIQSQKINRKFSKIGYIDLYAGPGKYEDGTNSTPIIILTQALKDKDISDRLLALFNDKSEENVKSLRETIGNIEGIEKLKYPPVINNVDVDDEIAKIFEDMHMIPSFFFIDPWGYKGLSIRLINALLKDWGCDGVFFFNYNRINMAISNKKFNENMNNFFGEERAKSLREKIKNQNAVEREATIIDGLCNALKEYSYKYILPFRFISCETNKTSHYLIFVSKEFLGYEIMKEIMYKESSECNDDIGSFEYDPSAKLAKQTLLFNTSGSIQDLKNLLMKDFHGKKLTMDEIYRQHSIDKPYVKRNYKRALLELETEKAIEASPHRSKTFGDGVIVAFPT